MGTVMSACERTRLHAATFRFASIAGAEWEAQTPVLAQHVRVP